MLNGWDELSKLRKQDPKIIDADEDSSVVESSSTEEVPNKDKG